MRIVLWLVGGIAGSLLFWAVQMLTGGPTITEFIGAQIVAAGHYPAAWTLPIGWGVHMGVGLSYALLMAVTALLVRRLPSAQAAAIGLVAALGLGWVTAIIAPPAISGTISLLGRRGWPAQLFPLNTEINLPLWNHILFFILNWVVQVLGPRALGRP